MSKRRETTDVFAAIADPTRRRLLDLLRQDGEQKVMVLAERFPITLAGVSQHLRLLREAGLVRVRRSGRERYYRINAAPLRRVSDWIAFYERFWRRKLDGLEEYLKGEE